MPHTHYVSSMLFILTRYFSIYSATNEVMAKAEELLDKFLDIVSNDGVVNKNAGELVYGMQIL